MTYVALPKLSTCQQKHPKLSLLGLFVAWKLVLLVIAYSSPYPGYDTSTTLLFPGDTPDIGAQHIFIRIFRTLASKLTRWDAIYFTQISYRGALFEQEWAFGWGFAKLLSTITRSVCLEVCQFMSRRG